MREGPFVVLNTPRNHSGFYEKLLHFFTDAGKFLSQRNACTRISIPQTLPIR
jgi:hypothetical protein